MNCKEICMFCDSIQVRKVNYAQDHGVCHNHLIMKSTISTCIHCNSTHPVLEFKFCVVCQKQNKDFSDSCCKVLCQDCKSTNFFCPQCFRCDACLSSSNLLKKAECGHVLCESCLIKTCQICHGFAIGQTESFEISQEKSVFDDSLNLSSPKDQFGSLVQSESFLSQDSKEYEESGLNKLVVDVEEVEKAENSEKLESWKKLDYDEKNENVEKLGDLQETQKSGDLAKVDKSKDGQKFQKIENETKGRVRMIKKSGNIVSVTMVLGVLIVLSPIKIGTSIIGTGMKLFK